MEKVYNDKLKELYEKYVESRKERGVIEWTKEQ